jgi:CubicO group peptidase (beta-lactamase class C family)
MRKIAFLLMVVLMLSTLITANADDIDTQVDSIFKSHKTVGGSLVIALHGEIVYQRDYGFANKSQKTLVTPQTYFRIASVTKMISAIGIMQLVEQNKIDLDADISTYFGYEIEDPYFPDISLTLRQAMSHTMPLNELGGYGLSPGSRTIYDLLSKDNYYKNNFTKVKPGTEYRYSNFGAGLMGSIMEKVTQLSINQFMTESVFKPLNIDAAFSATLLSSPDDISAVHENGRLKRAGSYYLKQPYDDTVDPENHYRTTVGSLWIRSRDIAKLAIALCGDGIVDGVRLLTQQSVEQMRMNQKDLGASVTGDSPYGLCTARVDDLIEGHMLYGHQGMASGTMCNVYYEPDTEFVFVLLTNGCSQNRDDRIGKLPKSMISYLYPVYVK